MHHSKIGSKPAVISALAPGLLYLSQPTLAVRVGTWRSCQGPTFPHRVVRSAGVASRRPATYAFAAAALMP